MLDKIEELSSFPPNSNPYHHDHYNMGQDFSKEWHMMFENHTTESAKWVIFIHTPTGRRFRINLNNLLEQ